MSGESFSEKMKEFLARVRGLVSETEKRFEELYREGREGEAVKALAEGLEKIAREIAEISKFLEASLGQARGEGLEREVEEFKSRIEAELDELRKHIDKVVSEHKGRAAAKAAELSSAFSKMVEEALRHTARTAEDAFKNLREVFREVTRAVAETVVVSARIHSSDLELIDRLVDAGVFKSRSEAVAYFTRKGIEASRDWINRALEQAERIRELKSSLRREVEGYLGRQ
ncbi:M protein [Thermogladius sp.]|uniref:M protein n=1 Tax=Thermogladius sp. TaxID=2023064 RepID=UPI003D128943